MRVLQKTIILIILVRGLEPSPLLWRQKNVCIPAKLIKLKQSAKFGFARRLALKKRGIFYFESIPVNIVTSSNENFLVEYLENGKWE